MTWFSSKRANPVRVASGFLLGVFVWACGLSVGLAQANPDALSALDKIKAKGVLTVAVYKDNPPFSEQAGEVDVTLAQLLADELGVKLSLMPFDAGENMGDDLRNMVWKGHYLGYGPADVMLHVPVDRNFMQQNKQARIFGPYYRETVVLAHDRKQIRCAERSDRLRQCFCLGRLAPETARWPAPWAVRCVTRCT